MFYSNGDELVVVDGFPFQIQVIDQFFAGTPFVMYQLQSDQGTPVVIANRFTPRKANMSPENQWLEDVFPFEIVPF